MTTDLIDGRLTPELAAELKQNTIRRTQNYWQHRLKYGGNPWPVDEAKVRELTTKMTSGTWIDSRTILMVDRGDQSIIHGLNRVEACLRSGVPISVSVELFPPEPPP